MLQYERVANAMIKDGGFYTAARMVAELDVNKATAHNLIHRLIGMYGYQHEFAIIDNTKSYRLLPKNTYTRRATLMRAALFGTPIPKEITQGVTQ